MSKKHTTPAAHAVAPTGPQPIVFLRSHPAYAYNSGDKATLSPEHTTLLVNGGFARFDEAETAVTPTDETR